METQIFVFDIPVEKADEIVDKLKVFQLQQIHTIINPGIIAK